MKEFWRDVFDRDFLVFLTQVGLVLAVITLIAIALVVLEKKGW